MGATVTDDDGFDTRLRAAARPVTPRSPQLNSTLAALSAAITASPPRRRRIPVAAVALVPLLVLGGAGAAFAASGLDWSRFWFNTPAWTGWAIRPDAEVTYRLPGGGACTMRIGQVTVSPASYLPAGVAPADPAAAGIARRYLQTSSVLRDAPIREVLDHDRKVDRNYATTSDGKQVPFGYGTANYNPDVEYADAVRQAIQVAITRHVEEAGYPSTGLGYQSQEQCAGMRQ